MGGFELNRAPEVTETFELAPEVFIVDSTIRSLQSTVSGSRHSATDLIKIGQAVDRLGVRELLVNLAWRDGLDVAAGLGRARPRSRVIGTFRARISNADRLLLAGIDAGVDEICIESPPDAAFVHTAAGLLADAGLGLSVAFAEKHSWDEVMALSEVAIECGSRSLSFHDSYFRLGVHPEAMKAFIRKVRGALPSHPPLYIHLSNFYGHATMTAVAGIIAGASAIDCCVNQSGHHCGHISMAEACMVLEDLYGIDTGIDLALITEVVKEVTERTGIPIAPTKSVVGEMAFMIDGADWAAEAHLPPDERMHSRLPFGPEHVGAQGAMVWSDRTATDASIAVKLESMGLPSTEAASRRGLEALAAATGRLDRYPGWISDGELESVLRESESSTS